MTTRWLDPFLEATTQGNGTTDTSTRNGTYAAPFSINDFYFTSSAAVDAINSVTLVDGDELRIKGLPFTTLFESHGNVYSDISQESDGTPALYPVTGNSSFDATISTSKSSLFAFQNSDITSVLPNWTHPLFFAAFYSSSSSQLESGLGGNFVWSVIKTQLGHAAASDTGIEVFRLKDTYSNYLDFGSSRRYIGIFNKLVTVSAGWTSETAQEGYSVMEYANSSNYNYVYWAYSTNKTIWNAERLISCHAPRASDGHNNNIYGYFNNHTSAARTHVTPMFVNASGRSNYYYGADYNNGDSTTFPLIVGNDNGTTNNMPIVSQTYRTATRTTIFKNIIIPNIIYIFQNHVNNDLKFGNIYCRASSNTDGGITANRPFSENNTDNVRGKKITFLQNSVYFIGSSSDSVPNILSPILSNLDYGGISGSVTYESGLKKPGIAPLNNVPVSNGYGPTAGGIITTSSAFAETKDVSANNDWFASSLSRESKNPIAYNSLAKLTCNSADYRTTAHNITYSTSTALSATAAPQYVIWSAEHNDYDGKPLSLITDPYTAGTGYASLLYNDTVSSVGVLVAQWAGTTGGSSTQAWIPLELAVPSYTAGSDNLRVTVSAAYADGASNSAAGSILLRAWHRDTTQSGNFRVYSSSATAISAGGNAASPTTVTLNLSNVPTSGQERITSVILGIRVDFTSNTNIQKYYVTNAAIETY